MKRLPGFTIIELIVVMTIFAVVAGLITVNLIRPQTKSSLDATVNVLASDIKQQQLKAMVGDTDGAASAQNFGIYFESNKYTIFSGSSFIVGPNNFVVNMEPNMTISNFPTSPSNPIIFSRRSGEVINFAPGQNSVTIQNTDLGAQKTITINIYGALTIN